MGDLLHDGGMQAAFIAAMVLALVSVLLRRVLEIEFAWPWVALTGAAVGLAVEVRVVPALVWGIALLIAGALVASGRGLVLGAGLALPGALALALAMPSGARTWMRAALVVVVVVTVPLATATERLLPWRSMPVLMLGSTWGVFVCVPETGPVHSLLGALVPAVLLGIIVRCAPEPVATAPLVGMLLWTAAAGGAPRPGSVVGGLACVGVLVLVPFAPRAPIALIVAVDAALVLFVARVAGFRTDAAAAAALVAAAFAGAMLVLLVGQRWSARAR